MSGTMFILNGNTRYFNVAKGELFEVMMPTLRKEFNVPPTK